MEEDKERMDADAKGGYLSMATSTRAKSDDAEMKQPRRPRRERQVETDQNVDSFAQDKAAEPMGADASQAASKPRRKRQTENNEDASGGGGWMVSPTKQKDAIEEEEEPKDSAIEQNKDKFFQENNDEIMIIPDLDEDGYDEDARVAHAPRNINRKIPTLEELEKEVTAAIPSVEDGLDLGVLLRTLVPASMVMEQDVAWTFESLLRDVTDELTAPTKTVIEPNTAEFAEATKAHSPKGNNNTKREKKEKTGSGNEPRIALK
jgi:hypothetical protein